MSDFLSNLIDRSLAPEAQVAPRPVSLFEPAGERGAGLEQPEELEQVFTAPASPPAPRQVIAPQVAPRPAPMPPGHEPAVAHAAPPASLVAPPVSRTPLAPVEQPRGSDSRGAEPTLLDPGALRVEPYRPPMPYQQERPVPAPDETSRAGRPAERVIVEHTIVQERVISTPLREQGPPERTRALPVEPARAEPPVAPPRQPQAELQLPVSTRLVHEEVRSVLAIQPRVEPTPLREVPSTQRPEPEPAPVIQVTIGRIEVRAGPAPAQPRRERATPSVMSLDEYLRQRSQGGDR